MLSDHSYEIENEQIKQYRPELTARLIEAAIVILQEVCSDNEGALKRLAARAADEFKDCQSSKPRCNRSHLFNDLDQLDCDYDLDK